MPEPLGLGAPRDGLGSADAAASRHGFGNEAWASKKAPVGLKLLQKMGWKDGKGLGANEDGRLSHVRVSRKTNAIGIGATAADIQRGWDTPREVATGLNDVLTKLSAVGGSGGVGAGSSSGSDSEAVSDTESSSENAEKEENDATVEDRKARKASTASAEALKGEEMNGDTAQAETTSAGSKNGEASNLRKRRIHRGFYARKRALKTVGSYSKQELAEIFGHAANKSEENLDKVESGRDCDVDASSQEQLRVVLSPSPIRFDDDETSQSDKERDDKYICNESAVTLQNNDRKSTSERTLDATEKEKKKKKKKGRNVEVSLGVSDGSVKKRTKEKKKKKKKKMKKHDISEK